MSEEENIEEPKTDDKIYLVDKKDYRKTDEAEDDKEGKIGLIKGKGQGQVILNLEFLALKITDFENLNMPILLCNAMGSMGVNVFEFFEEIARIKCEKDEYNEKQELFKPIYEEFAEKAHWIQRGMAVYPFKIEDGEVREWKKDITRDTLKLNSSILKQLHETLRGAYGISDEDFVKMILGVKT